LFKRPEIIRPPSEWRSYYLPLTSGCSNNTCTFCNFYGAGLQIRNIEDVKQEIEALSLYRDKGLVLNGIPKIVYALGASWDGNQVFLQDGDALVYPVPKLKEVLAFINQKLPQVQRIAAYATAQDILRIDTGELKELRRLKLGILYIGLESGNDDILKRISKGVDSAQMIEACKRVKEAGILTSVTVLLGLGGVEGSDKHTLETARVLTEMDPDYVGALTLTLITGTPLEQEYRQGKFSVITPFQSIIELLTIIKNSSFTNCFFSSMHASNYFSIRGTLPRDGAKIINQLEKVIEEGDPSSLKPEFLRGL
jgi:radical SAM superfamily enzyme YgiQ (UPF0313 family)